MPFKRWLGRVPGMVVDTMAVGGAAVLVAFAVFVLRGRPSEQVAAGPEPGSAAMAVASASPQPSVSAVATASSEASPSATPTETPRPGFPSLEMWPYQLVIEGPSRAAPGDQVVYRISYTRVSTAHENWGSAFVFMWDNTKASFVSSRITSGPTGVMLDQMPGQSIRWNFDGPGSGSVEVVLQISPNAVGALDVSLYVPGTNIILPTRSVDRLLTEIAAAQQSAPSSLPGTGTGPTAGRRPLASAGPLAVAGVLLGVAGVLLGAAGAALRRRAGTPWLARTFLRDYRALLAKTAIENVATVNWHALRHSAATQWIAHGVDIFTVSRRLDASAAFTMDVYAHLLKGQQRQAAEALDYLLAKT